MTDRDRQISSLRVIWRFREYPLRYKRYIAGLYVCLTATTVLSLVIPRLLGEAVDETLTGGLRDEQLVLAVSIVIVGLFRAMFGWGQILITYMITLMATRGLQTDVFGKLLHLSFGFYDRQRTGDLMSRAMTDVSQPIMLLVMGLSRTAAMGVMLVGVAGLMLVMNWRLGLISLVFVSLYIWRTLSKSARLQEIWRRVQAETGIMNAVMEENLAGIRVVKAFGAGEYEEAKFEPRASAIDEHSYRAERYWTLRSSLFLFISTVSVGTILWFGGREIVAGRLTPGELATFILYLGLMTTPIHWGVYFILNSSRVVAAGRRVLEVLDADSPVKEASNARPMSRVRGHVKFENVSLSYDSSASVLNGISFEVQPGQLVALLGPPGSGKSSIVHLVPRFYDVSAGRVIVDGIDVRHATLESLRRNVGVVLQDTFAFSATFKENIAFGAEGSTPEEIARAAKIAQLHEFIIGLPDGYDTWVGERGVKLSGGQRQRLTIARTILLDPPILILDDSTSSVDVGTEYEIQKALAEVIKGRTTFVIAHRLSTVREADLILVMDRGEIAEYGSHDELLAQDGFYRHIFDLQLAPTVEEAMAASSARTTGGITE